MDIKLDWTRVIFGFLTFAATYNIVNSIECYTDVEGKTIVTCSEVDGFRTCFTKYNDSKYIPSAFPFGVLYNYQVESNIVGRGCSTKDKVFYRECETFSYGESLEKMCFCSFKLCNAATPTSAPSACHTLLILASLTYILVHTHWTSSTAVPSEQLTPPLRHLPLKPLAAAKSVCISKLLVPTRKVYLNSSDKSSCH